MLALVALLAGTVVAYGLVVLLLHSLRVLPGLVGRVAGRLMSLVTPAVVQRLLDLLVGGALLAKATLAAVRGPLCPKDECSFRRQRRQLASLTLTRSGLWTAPR